MGFWQEWSNSRQKTPEYQYFLHLWQKKLSNLEQKQLDVYIAFPAHCGMQLITGTSPAILLAKLFQYLWLKYKHFALKTIKMAVRFQNYSFLFRHTAELIKTITYNLLCYSYFQTDLFFLEINIQYSAMISKCVAKNRMCKLVSLLWRFIQWCMLFFDTTRFIKRLVRGSAKVRLYLLECVLQVHKVRRQIYKQDRDGQQALFHKNCKVLSITNDKTLATCATLQICKYTTWGSTCLLYFKFITCKDHFLLLLHVYNLDLKKLHKKQ